jgi:hypothetical protein
MTKPFSVGCIAENGSAQLRPRLGQRGQALDDQFSRTIAFVYDKDLTTFVKLIIQDLTSLATRKSKML